jgi:hypothetical protein
MSVELKKQLITQLVESSRFLRNYIDHRAKERGTTRAQWIVLFRLRDQEGLSQVDLADVLELQPISLVRPAGSAGQPAVPDGGWPSTRRRSRQSSRCHSSRCAAGSVDRNDREQP